MVAGQKFAQDQATVTVDLALPYFLADLVRLGRLLESCVQVHQGGAGEVEEAVAGSAELARRLCLGVLEICDLSRIVSSLNLDQALEEAEADEAPEPASGDELDVQVMGVATLARAFGAAPHEVMTWPYQEFLELAPCVEEWREEELVLARMAAGGNGLSARPPVKTVNIHDDASMAALGFHVRRRAQEEPDV